MANSIFINFRLVGGSVQMVEYSTFVNLKSFVTLNSRVPVLLHSSRFSNTQRKPSDKNKIEKRRFYFVVMRTPNEALIFIERGRGKQPIKIECAIINSFEILNKYFFNKTFVTNFC